MFMASASPFTVIASPTTTFALVRNSLVTACRSPGGSGLSNPSRTSGVSAGDWRRLTLERRPGAGRWGLGGPDGALRMGGGVARMRGGVARRTGRITVGTILRSVAPGRNTVVPAGEAMLRVSMRRDAGARRRSGSGAVLGVAAIRSMPAGGSRRPDLSG